MHGAHGSPIQWYSMTEDVEVEERGPIELAAALKLVDQYCANRGRKYERAEDSIVATQFGFCRGEDDFVEICLIAEEEIWLRTEHPLPTPEGLWRRLFAARTYARKLTLRTPAEVKHHVTAYFQLALEDFRAHLNAA